MPPITRIRDLRPTVLPSSITAGNEVARTLCPSMFDLECRSKAEIRHRLIGCSMFCLASVSTFLCVGWLQPKREHRTFNEEFFANTFHHRLQTDLCCLTSDSKQTSFRFQIGHVHSRGFARFAGKNIRKSPRITRIARIRDPLGLSYCHDGSLWSSCSLWLDFEKGSPQRTPRSQFGCARNPTRTLRRKLCREPCRLTD